MISHLAGEKLTVVVATRDRARKLVRMLRSLESERDDLEELVVVVNGTRDEGRAYDSRELRSIAARWGSDLRFLCTDRPGKARALNLALEHIPRENIAFLDDDVRVRPGWARAYREAFRREDAAGFQGPILAPFPGEDDLVPLPAEPDAGAAGSRAGSHAVAMDRWDALRTMPRVGFDYTPNGHVPHLVGANMALRRSVVLEAGGFDERLGPGAGGLCEDTELSMRVRALRGEFSFVRGASVEHELDVERLTDRYFEDYYRRLGRSRYIQKANSLLFSILPNLAKAALFSVATLPAGNPSAHYRQRGRYYSYHEMLIHSLGLARNGSG